MRSITELTETASAIDVPTLISAIREQHQSVSSAVARGLQHAREAGRLLSQLKQVTPHGEYLNVVTRDCGLSRSAAAGYVRVHEHWDDVQRVAHLPLRKVLAMLAEPKPQGCKPSLVAVDAEVDAVRRKYLESRRRDDKSNGIIERTVCQLRYSTDDAEIVDFGELDQRCLGVWSSELRESAREILKLARRLEKQAMGVTGAAEAA